MDRLDDRERQHGVRSLGDHDGQLEREAGPALGVQRARRPQRRDGGCDVCLAPHGEVAAPVVRLRLALQHERLAEPPADVQERRLSAVRRRARAGAASAQTCP